MYRQRRILMLLATPHSRKHFGSMFGLQVDDLSGPYVTQDHLGGMPYANFPEEIPLQSLTVISKTHASAAKVYGTTETNSSVSCGL
jgi:hypothetical protein